MKVAVANYSGSVGKTAMASHLLAPRIPDAEFFAVETINEGAGDLGLEVDQLRGEQFGLLFRKLMIADAAIIDVGASNVEDFLGQLVKYHDAHREIDYFVLPTVSSGKAQRETISTAKALAGIGIEAERIRVLFNRVEVDVIDEFAAIFGYARTHGGLHANPEACVYENEVFDLLSNRGMTIKDVLADGTDYRQQLREADRTDTALIRRLSDLHALQSLARPVDAELDRAFAALFM